ncbi:hypothetical protein AB8Z38_34305 [Bradyrhizobium sp. LLZ17]|uniref:Uncharacterized protein n=1 Tax=Bradyrhizobium sp. LLZ17 TaxID=3239388 RepID=A0AB39XI15_9BRAD
MVVVFLPALGAWDHIASANLQINSLAAIAKTDDFVREATNKVGLQRLFLTSTGWQSNGRTLIPFLREAAG